MKLPEDFVFIEHLDIPALRTPEDIQGAVAAVFVIGGMSKADKKRLAPILTSSPQEQLTWLMGLQVAYKGFPEAFKKSLMRQIASWKTGVTNKISLGTLSPIFKDTDTTEKITKEHLLLEILGERYHKVGRHD